MKSFASPITKSFWRITVPRLPISSSTTPFQASRPASVTTNDGTPTLVMIRPCSTPIPSPAASAIKIATAVGSSLPSGVSSSATSTPPTPETKPIERSISPSSSANVTPIAITAYGAVCTIRLTKFDAVRKRSFWIWKTIAITTRPTMIGSEPRSPDLTSVEPAARVRADGLARRRARRRGGLGDGAHVSASCWPGTLESLPAVIASTTCCWFVSERL